MPSPSGSNIFQILIPELWWLFNIRQDATTQQTTWVTSNTAVKTSNLMSFPWQAKQYRLAPYNIATRTSAVFTLPTVTFHFWDHVLWKYMNFALQCCSSEYGRRDIALGIERNPKNNNAPPNGSRGVASNKIIYSWILLFMLQSNNSSWASFLLYLLKS